MGSVECINSHPVATSSRTGKTNKRLPQVRSNFSDEALVAQNEDPQMNPADAISERFGSLVRSALLRRKLKPSLVLLGTRVLTALGCNTCPVTVFSSWN